MSALAKTAMTVEDYVTWSRLQSDDAKFELIDGVPVRAMAPATILHGRIKVRLWEALSKAIDRAGLPCEAFLDSVGVRIDDTNACIPDVSVQCAPVADHAIWLDSPLILVEIVSPSSGRRDGCDKLIDYFRLPYVVHCLVVYPEERVVVHHRRSEGDIDIATRILSEGEIVLSPPGIAVTIADFFEPEAPGPVPS